MKPKAIIFAIIGTVIILIGLFALFLALMAAIAGASWSILMGLAGLVLIIIGGVFGYLAYSSTQEDKMDDARYHNMERQVLALAKKNKGSRSYQRRRRVGRG